MMICVAINDILCRNQTLLLHVVQLSDGIGNLTVLVKISSAGAFNLTLYYNIGLQFCQKSSTSKLYFTRY